MLVLHWNIVYLELLTINADSGRYSNPAYSTRFDACPLFSLSDGELDKLLVLVWTIVNQQISILKNESSFLKKVQHIS